MELKYQFQVFGFIPVVQEAIVADLLETGGQHMHQITPDEFSMVQGNLTSGFTGLFPSGRKSDRIIGNRKDPAVCNSDLVGITSKILDGIAKAVKGFLNIGTPVHFIEFVFPFFLVTGITQLFTGRRKSEGTFFVKRRKVCDIFPFKFVPQYFCADKKFLEDFRIFLSLVSLPPETIQCMCTW